MLPCPKLSLWGAKLGTPEGERLDMLAILIDSYEKAHYPMKVGTEVMRQYRNTLRKLSE